MQAAAWYLRYPLSYRDLEEMFQERGFEADHSTINRWVLAYAPMIEKRLRQFRRSHCGSVRIDETYVKIRGKWRYLYGKSGKGGCTAMFLDREGKVQSAHFRMPEARQAKGKGDPTAPGGEDGNEAAIDVSAKTRPDVTRNGIGMIGDFRTDALHEALARAPIEDDTLMAMLVLAFAGQNVSVDSGSEVSGHLYGSRRFVRHVVRLIGESGKLEFDMDTLRVVARLTLIDALSARTNRSDSGVVVRVAGDAIGADAYLPNMGTEEFLTCLSRPALEASCGGTSVVPCPRVRDTRAALVEHFKEERFVHQSALFAPDDAKLAEWLAKSMEHGGNCPPGDRSFRAKTPHAGPRSGSLRLSRCVLNKRKFNEGRKAFRSSREVCWRGSLLTVD